MDATATDDFCFQTCHVHPGATETWIKSKHFTTKSGVVTHCTDCHLPGTSGPEYYTEKARLGAKDLYGMLFKDISKIDWVSKRTLDRARTFTYESACIRCHQNLFSAQLSKKGVDGHLHYQRSKDRLRCINCHLHTGHDRGKEAEEITGSEEAAERELDKQFPASPAGFQNYTEIIPGAEVKMRMVAVPAGTFEMGSPATEPYRRADEGPGRQVRLSQFWMGRVEVTWREFDAYYTQRGTGGRQEFVEKKADAVTGPTPPYGSPDQGWGKGLRPAITMSHHAATEYTKWLSQVTGKKFRLPTEAEWEYAARAGSKSAYFFPGEPRQFTERYWLNRFLGVKTVPIGEYAWYLENSNMRASAGRYEGQPLGPGQHARERARVLPGLVCSGRLRAIPGRRGGESARAGFGRGARGPRRLLPDRRGGFARGGARLDAHGRLAAHRPAGAQEHLVVLGQR